MPKDQSQVFKILNYRSQEEICNSELIASDKDLQTHLFQIPYPREEVSNFDKHISYT